MFNAVILNQNEEILTFLDPDLVDIVESNEIGQLRTISVKYPVDTEEDVGEVFKLGNKIWIRGDSNFTNCLYVMNSPIKRDYFDDKLVSFEAEDVLVELNYAPFFSQTDLTAANGFTITKDTSQNNEDNVLIDYKALKYWFNDYYNIGIVQKCLTDYVQKISLSGTMSLMELLRYIETETGNVFRTRYEKDVNSNLIHRYLDFLNPENANKSWELNLECQLLSENDADENLFDDDPTDETLYQVSGKSFNPADLTVQLLDENEELIVFNKGLSSEKSLEWNVSELGYANEDIAHITLTYENNSSITIKCDSKNFTVPMEVNQLGTVVDNDFTSIAGDPETHFGILPDVTIFQVKDSDERIVYRQTISPVLGEVHEEVLDLAYNVENIEYSVDENDTYTAISPVLSLSSGGGNSLTKANMDTIITRWINLSVNKGDTIPMIIQKITVTGDDNNPIKNLAAAENKLNTMDISSNYWVRPVKPNDSTEGDSNSNKSYEFLVATAYCSAPFTKNAGEMFITDETITGVDYNQIKGKNDDFETRNVKSTPKMGRVETSDEDPYAIYNDAAMKLKDKRYPEINLDVDVANLKNHNYNDYNTYDKVYIKIPLFDHLITARVKKTIKNSKNIAENKVELGSYNINVRTPLQPVLIEGTNISFNYPKSQIFTVTLEDYDGNPLKNKLISFSLANVENGSNTVTGKTKNVKTNSEGKASITCKYDPGNYEITCQFGGDESYEPTSSTFSINVSGTKEEPKSTNTTNTKKASKTKTITKTIKRYYDKYGRSPDKKKILAIGRVSAGRDSGSYANFYETEFENYCPKCKQRGTLMWGIFWAGNEYSNWGRFPGTGNQEGSSAEGAIFCSNQRCDGDWSVQGHEHGYTGTDLKVTKSRKISSKSKAYQLRQGKVLFDKIKKVVSAKNNTGNNSQPSNSAVSKTIINKSHSIVGSHTGLQAAKDCLNFVTYKINWEDRNNFYQTPEKTLSRKKGNCCCQTELLFELMDAAGVTETYKLQYIHTVGGKGGHVFGRLVNKKTGKGVYIDPCNRSKPYGDYCQGYGKIGSAPSSWYPQKPF
ncbi:MAG: hypothetical protein IJI96_02790 [Methanobrevibacter sp.]|nr:hypothetical protein [Methanobrevibacter sp.]MBQ6627434.1 hypothetical protein [Methanobrevibacter sp.]